MLSQLVRRAGLASIVFLALQLFAAGSAHAVRFAFDQKKSEVRFLYTMALAPQQGRFTRVAGTLDYDDARPEKTQVTAAIATASLTTGYSIIDAELKGASFFNAGASPVIAFKSRAVTPTGEGAADVIGDITVNGVTNPVVLKVSLRPHIDAAMQHDREARELVATTRIQRSAFKMTDWPLMVGDDVDIEIKAVLRPRN